MNIYRKVEARHQFKNLDSYIIIECCYKLICSANIPTNAYLERWTSNLFIARRHRFYLILVLKLKSAPEGTI